MPGLACPEANLQGHCFSDSGTADLSFPRWADPGTVTQHLYKPMLSTARSKSAVAPGALLGTWQVLREKSSCQGWDMVQSAQFLLCKPEDLS